MEGLEWRFHSPRDYLELARSPDATPEQLAELAETPFDFVHVAVAEHPATPTQVLERLLPTELARWNDQAMIVALARHPSSSSSILRSIAQFLPEALHRRDGQHTFKAGVELFRRHDIDFEILRVLLDDPRTTTEFRKVAARETTRGDVLEKLGEDRSEKVRRAAAKRAGFQD